MVRTVMLRDVALAGRRPLVAAGPAGNPVDVVVLVDDGAQELDVAGPLDVFTAANQVVGTEAYATMVATRGAVTSSADRAVPATADARSCGVRAGHPTTLLVVGSWSAPTPSGLSDDVRRLAPSCDRVASVCIGAFALAAAGQLDGRRATTHWSVAAALADRHPAVQVDADEIVVGDGGVWTSAGVTAGIDLALALVAEDLGDHVALEVARWLVHFLRRPGGQAQFRTPSLTDAPPRGPVRAAMRLVRDDPTADHRLEELSARVGCSRRQLQRRFREETGVTPATWIRRVRVDVARALLTTTRSTLPVVARRAGLGSEEALRRAFLTEVGCTPGDYRERFTTPVRS